MRLRAEQNALRSRAERGREVARRVLLWLASLKLTLAILSLFAAGIVAYYLQVFPSAWSLAVPLALLAANLGAAVVTNPVFRRQAPLLSFHLALIVLVLLVAVGQLSKMTGHVELSEGEAFSGVLTGYQAGPWHRLRLDQVRFTNEGFTIDYAEGVRRARTRNTVSWIDEDGVAQRGVIGDHDPLVLHGYRFYTSFNKGFAPTFAWYPEGATNPEYGTVHLPSYPRNELSQAQEWTPPGSDTKLWIMLEFDEVILDPAKPSQFRAPKQHKLIVRLGTERYELVPGERLSLPGGVLGYEGLRTWMGYTVFADWTIPWLLAACVVAVLSLAWHFWKKFAATPWNP